MGGRRRNLPLLIGMIVSLCAHGYVLLPLLVQTMHGPGGPTITMADFDPEDLRVPDPDPELPDEPILGREEGAPSTLTWIGYEEYEEHLARLSEVEQAAFVDQPTGDDGEPQPAPVPEQETTPGEDVSTAAVAAASEAPPEAEVSDPVEPATTAAPEQQTGLAPPGAQLTAEAQEDLADLLASLMTPLGAALRPPAEQDDKPVDPAHLQDPAAGRDQPTEQPTPTEEPTKKAGAQAAPAQPTTADAPPGTPEQGEKADKESDASSTVDIPLDKIRVGKPLAAQGLELRPRRPRFTTLQRLTAAAGNPIVEIRFGRDGVPRRASILQSSGNRGIDRAIESSLYRWRASGKQLESLGEKETVDLRLRIILSGRR
ncbi:MAG: energy transducer TonB [Planctomycetota bacterium]